MPHIDQTWLDIYRILIKPGLTYVTYRPNLASHMPHIADFFLTRTTFSLTCARAIQYLSYATSVIGVLYKSTVTRSCRSARSIFRSATYVGWPWSVYIHGLSVSSMTAATARQAMFRSCCALSWRYVYPVSMLKNYQLPRNSSRFYREGPR